MKPWGDSGLVNLNRMPDGIKKAATQFPLQFKAMQECIAEQKRQDVRYWVYPTSLQKNGIFGQQNKVTQDQASKQERTATQASNAEIKQQLKKSLIKEYPDPLFTFIGLFSSQTSVNTASSYAGVGSVPYTSRSYISSQAPPTTVLSARKTSPILGNSNNMKQNFKKNNKKAAVKVSISNQKNDISIKINRPIAATGGYRQKAQVSFNLNQPPYQDMKINNNQQAESVSNNQNIFSPQPVSLKQKLTSNARSQTSSKEKLNPKLTTNSFNHKLSKDFSSHNTPSISLYTKMKQQLQKPSFLQDFQTHAKLTGRNHKKNHHTGREGSARLSGTSSPFQTQYSNMTTSQTFNHHHHHHKHSHHNSGGTNSYIISRKGSIQIAQEKLSKLLNDIKSKRMKKKKLDSTNEIFNFNTQSDIVHQNIQFSKIAEVSNHHNTSHSSRGKSSGVISRKKHSIQPPQTAEQELRRHINLVYLKGSGYKTKAISGNLMITHSTTNSIAETGVSRKKQKSPSPKPLSSRVKTGNMRKSLDKLITTPIILNRNQNDLSQLNKTINTIEEKTTTGQPLLHSAQENKRKKPTQSKPNKTSSVSVPKRQIGTAYTTSNTTQKTSPRVEMVNKYWTNKREIQSNRADKKQLADALANNEVNKFKLPKIKRVPFNAGVLNRGGGGGTSNNNSNKVVADSNNMLKRDGSNIKISE